MICIIKNTQYLCKKDCTRAQYLCVGFVDARARTMMIVVYNIPREKILYKIMLICWRTGYNVKNRTIQKRASEVLYCAQHTIAETDTIARTEAKAEVRL